VSLAVTPYSNAPSRRAKATAPTRPITNQRM
jgi:hypothetical protein